MNGRRLLSHLIQLLTVLDRRVIYLFVALSLAIPLISETTLRPAPMSTANAFFGVLEKRQPENTPMVLIAMDWGPSTKAENGAQTEVAIEHLIRRRIPFAVISLSPYAGPLLESVPQTVLERLQREYALEAEQRGATIEIGEASDRITNGASEEGIGDEGTKPFQWQYGVDWVNLGYQPNGSIFIQNLAKSDDIVATLGTDARGSPLHELPIMARVKTLRDIPVFIQFTGLVGTFNSWLQFLRKGDYQPTLLHGCTSITIPEAYIYYVSKQIAGLFEGLAGAAAYEDLLTEVTPTRSVGSALRQNTSLAIAQLVILGFVVLGNLGHLLRRWIVEDDRNDSPSV